MKTRTLTAARVRELLTYNKATGELRWRVNRGPVHAGDRAGGVTEKSPGQFYRQLRVDGVLISEHLVIWLWMTGKWPSPECDHQDGDGTNNRWSNLREATHAQNVRNTACRIDNRVGLKGVKLTPNGTFQASIRAHLGTFKTKHAASAAYAKAAAALHGAFANTKSRAAAKGGPGL